MRLRIAVLGLDWKIPQTPACGHGRASVHHVLALGPPRWGPCGDLCLLLGVPHGPREVGCCAGDCPLAWLQVPGRCLSPGQLDPVCSHALKRAALAGLGTAAPQGSAALCPGARAGGGRGCCATLAPPHPIAVSSSQLPGHHSLLPVPSREIINGVTVTDEDNNELGHSRVSLWMCVWG